MKPCKIFLDELEQDFQGIYKVSDLVAREYFASQPSKESLLDHFKRKMFNERWNMVEISQKVAALPVDTDPKECLLLSKQAMDEARHFQLVMEVLEHINGEPIDIHDAQRTHGTKNPSQGASLIDKYEAHNDPMALAVYQFLAEGRAAVVWQTMADIVEDKFVASRYARIARDEKFHSNIGRMKLEQLCQSDEAQQKVLDIVKEMYWDLYEVSCLSNTAPTQQMKDIMIKSYGQPTRELCVAL